MPRTVPPMRCPGLRAFAAPLAAEVERVTVTTSKGALEGFRRLAAGEGAPRHFRNVPFGAPVAGANRWKPPQPVEPWQGVRDCTRFGAACDAQDPDGGMNALCLGNEGGGAANFGRLGPDMLNLNIVAPADARAAPVLVWLHGGANKQGSNAETGVFFPGEAFARRGLVCVSLNYRLALSGFLHLPAQGVTNLALRDVLAGLRWVRDEVAAFGGAPDCVTLYGQSAGAVNIWALLASPLARGLFHRAILSSGGPNEHNAATYCGSGGTLGDFTAALKAACPGRVEVDAASGEPTLASLAALSGPDLHAAHRRVKDSLKGVHGLEMSPPLFGAWVGDDVLPGPVLPAIRTGVSRGVAVLTGNNSNEWAAFLVGLISRKLPRVLALPLASVALYRGMLDPATWLRNAATHGSGGGGTLLRGDPGGDDATIGKAVSSLLTGMRRLGKAAPASASAQGPRPGPVDPRGEEAREARGWLGRWCAVNEGDPAPALFAALGTARQFEAAEAHAVHSPEATFAYELRLLPAQGENQHGQDLGLVFKPDERDGFTPDEVAYVAQGMFGRPALGADVDALGETMRDVIAAFARHGRPGAVAGEPWTPLGGDRAGRMILAHPGACMEHWQGDQCDPKRALVLAALEATKPGGE